YIFERGLQSGPDLVAQSGPLHRYLLYGRHPVLVAVSAHQPDGRRRWAADGHYDNAGDCRLFRARTRPTGRPAILGAGGSLYGDFGLFTVLDSPRVSRRALLAFSRDPPFGRRGRLDGRVPISPGQSVARSISGDRRHVICRHFACRVVVSGSVQYGHGGVRARQSQLDARTFEICGGDASIPPLASHAAGRGREFQFRFVVFHMGCAVRHVLYAGKPASFALWRRRARLSARFPHAAHSPVPRSNRKGAATWRTYFSAANALIWRAAASTLMSMSARPRSAVARIGSPDTPFDSSVNGASAKRPRSTPGGCTAI